MHNFADDNSLNVKLIIESESKTAISWFQSNKMIVNPGKFQGIIINKKKQDHIAEYISTYQSKEYKNFTFSKTFRSTLQR